MKRLNWSGFLGKRPIVLLLLILIIIAVMPMFNQYFFTLQNLKVVLLSSSDIAIMSAGMMLLLILGEIDLTVGANYALSGTVSAILMKTYGLGVVPSIVAGLAITTIVGLINGVLIVRVGINFLITTLAMMEIVRGIVVVLAEAGIAFLPNGFDMLGQADIFGFQLPIWYMVLILVIVGFLAGKSKYFRQLYFIGNNRKAANLVGIKTKQIRMVAYMLSGLFAGFAGIMNTARFGSAFSTAGVGDEMTVIAAVVLGGCSLSGGEGEMFGVFLGVLVLSLLSNVLVALRVSTYWQQPITGLVLIGAIALDIAINKLQAERERLAIVHAEHS